MSQTAMTGGAGAEGKKQDIFLYKGVPMPPFCTEEHIDALMKMEFRPQDIILCTYPKAGTHWYYEMMRMLFVGRAEPERDFPLLSGLLEFPSCDLQKLEKMPSPRVFCTHLPFHVLPPSILANKCRLVVVERNAKDVTVSMFNMLLKTNINNPTSWNEHIDQFISGPMMNLKYYVMHVKGYRQAAEEMSGPPICFFTFEKTKQDHVEQVGRLSSFMGLDRTPKLWADIATLTEFKSMQKYKANEELPAFEKMVFQSGKDEMYRKGETGDWKNWFTVAQSELFDAVYLQEMGVPFKM